MVLTAFPPVAATDARTLILGSMPGVASLQEQRYYAHPRNAFWPIMARCLTSGSANKLQNKPLSDDEYHQLLDVLQQNRIALWDVLKHCERPGSLDSNIVSSSVECNDFPRFLKRYKKIDTVLFNGKTAERLFRKNMSAMLRSTIANKNANNAAIKTAYKAPPTLLCLPSTSPAMAAMNFEQKLELWRGALEQAGVATTSNKPEQEYH